ncbi:hypothetical protein JVU11DRAFT_6767 [Chiua virens]|nr:hypothetical protein JVU11DRAFT_6767 [Chiua virens]
MTSNERTFKTVAVLGGSYGGNRVAQILAAGLPSGWRVVLVDRNSHFNHVYNLPRYTVLPGHEHKAFIPYDNLFRNPSDPTSFSPHKRVHGTITSIHPHHITYTTRTNSDNARLPPSGPSHIETTEEHVLRFDYAIYALGSHLPSPIDLWESRATDIPLQAPNLAPSNLEKKNACPYTGLKDESVSWVRSRQRRIEAARQVLVVGGGALGIQFASDIAAIYPRKSVTLMHSRSRLLPRFDEALGDEAYQGLLALGVHVIFGERLDMSSFKGDGMNDNGDQETMSIKTVKGREIEADLVLLCTGQTPNTSLLHAMDPRTIDPATGMVRVSRTMQVLALEAKDTTTFDEDNLDGAEPFKFAHAMWHPSTFSRRNAYSEADSPYGFHTLVYPHLFAIGDAADAFGATKAGHSAYYQGELAARNVLRTHQRTEGDPSNEGWDSGEDLELEEYAPGPPMIKVSLGLTRSAYEVAGVVGTKDGGTDDLDAAVMWGIYGYKGIDDDGMRI